jgi:hypothetical protein
MLKMMKGKVVLLVLPFVFFLNANGAMAQDDRVAGQKGCVVPTVTANVDKPEGWNSPKIFKSSEEVDRNSFVKVWVDSEGWARPPYSWSVSGTGFHFGSVSGPTTATTNEDLEELELWADDTACGTGTVTVTDICDNTGTDYIFSDFGQWVSCYESGFMGACTIYQGYCYLYQEGHRVEGYFCHPGSGVNCHDGTCSDDVWSGTWCTADFSPCSDSPHEYWPRTLAYLTLYKWECVP